MCFLSTATSSHTKEDSPSEEYNNAREVAGPPRQTPSGGSPKANGSQEGRLFPPELSLRASGQHRNLYSRGADSTLRRFGVRGRPLLLQSKKTFKLALFSRLLLALLLFFFNICFLVAILSAHRQHHWMVGCAEATVIKNTCLAWVGPCPGPFHDSPPPKHLSSFSVSKVPLIKSSFENPPATRPLS